MSSSFVPPVPGLAALNERLGRPVDDPEVLAPALVHRSYCAENPGTVSNERLEFLGDSVLGIVITDHLFRTYPDLAEGELAKVRASVVSAAALSEVAIELALGEALQLGKGEDGSGGREKPSILADALEAVLGLVYIVSGYDTAAELVMHLLLDRTTEAASGPGGQDYKTRLQEIAARRFETQPRYEVVDDGPDHAKHFFATVWIDGAERGHGVGRSKKQAEQASARDAWSRLRDEAGDPVVEIGEPSDA
ncbi:MAG TPA: ribonuclease III [Acidimicrobiales bacterium]|nr:ribonuclease III [Acidimicrobiales bacterium]